MNGVYDLVRALIAFYIWYHYKIIYKIYCFF